MTLLQLLVGFGRVGLFAFGGGPSMIPLMQQEVVRAGWLTDAEFLDALALGNSLPGPIAVKMAVFVGWKTAGVLGVVAALTGVSGPAIVLMGLLTGLYLRFRDHPAVEGAMRAVRPVVVGMLAWTAMELAPSGVKDWAGGIIAVGAVVALALKVHPAVVVAVGMGIGAAFLR